MEVAPTRRGKMDSTPGRSGDSHPRCLVEEQREEYILPCPALPQSFSAGQVKILCKLKKCANLVALPAKLLPADIHDICIYSISNSIDK